MNTRAVFLDRDGVLIDDVHLLTNPEQVRILPGVPEALRLLQSAGLKLIVVSNQTVVARGLASEAEVESVNQRINALLQERSAPRVNATYFCPHHPNATLPQYRENCDCRKPRSGLFFKAAREHQIDLQTSFTVGDRITDIIAGNNAGCRTILVQTGKHTAAPIISVDAIDLSIQPDYTCSNLLQAAHWILKQ